MQSHYLIETVTRFKDAVYTEEGVDTLEQAKEYLNSLGYPEHVVNEAIKNLTYGDADSAYEIHITIKGSSYSNWCSKCRLHYINTQCDIHPK